MPDPLTADRSKPDWSCRYVSAREVVEVQLYETDARAYAMPTGREPEQRGVLRLPRDVYDALRRLHQHDTGGAGVVYALQEARALARGLRDAGFDVFGPDQDAATAPTS